MRPLPEHIPCDIQAGRGKARRRAVESAEREVDA